MAKRYCENCGVTHTALMCFNKPRGPLRNKSLKTEQKWIDTKVAWFDANPPDKKGFWNCYLQLDGCEGRVDRRTLNIEHVESRTRNPELRYVVENLKPSCRNCNKQKGSLSEAEAIEKFKT
jgi:hypothetical protein